MLTVVLDTNVVAAAIRSRSGASFELLRRLVLGEFGIAISAAMVFEYEEVIVRDLVPAFMSLAETDELIRFLCEIGQKFDPRSALRPTLPDADDDFVLELAVAANVRYVATHNVADFARAAAFGIEAIRPADLLKLLRGTK